MNQEVIIAAAFCWADSHHDWMTIVHDRHHSSSHRMPTRWDLDLNRDMDEMGRTPIDLHVVQGTVVIPDEVIVRGEVRRLREALSAGDWERVLHLSRRGSRLRRFLPKWSTPRHLREIARCRLIALAQMSIAAGIG